MLECKEIEKTKQRIQNVESILKNDQYCINFHLIEEAKRQLFY